MDRTKERGQADNGAQAAVADTWITVKDLQDILGIGHTKAYELVTTPGGIPSVRIGQGELTHWLEQQRYQDVND
jgi:hypothetical protein